MKWYRNIVAFKSFSADKITDLPKKYSLLQRGGDVLGQMPAGTLEVINKMILPGSKGLIELLKRIGLQTGWW